MNGLTLSRNIFLSEKRLDRHSCLRRNDDALESMKKLSSQEHIENTMYTRLIRLWLTTILLILPFQLKIADYSSSWSIKLSNIINNLDELTVAIFLLLAIREYYNHRKLHDKMFFFCFSP